ncbi:MAG TPA: DUF6542 domain-containing protein [Trebonia sp.]|nr:DUF6542 domain-containing protein [Trebonia sp.]
MNKGRPFGGPGGRVNGARAFQPSGVARWLGRLPTRTAMLMLSAGAVLGVIFSLMAGQEPGVLLGFFVVVGSIAAVLGIQRGKAYLLFPMPALMSFVAAIAIGKVHDSNLGSSTAGLASGFTQWVAGIFFPAVVATLMVVLIGGGRWLLGHQLITGQSILSPGSPARPSPPRGSARVAPPRPRRPAASAPARSDPARSDPARDAWADDNPFGEQQAFKTEMIPAVKQDQPAKPDQAAKPDQPAKQDQPAKPDRPAWMGRSGGAARQAARPPRDRDQRTDRDPWGDPRLPPDRSQPPGTGPRPDAQPQPRDGTSPRPSFNPSPNPPRPQRPQRRQPPKGWNPR